jgi:GNAT superfamily N-acetyltransferase
VIVDAAALDLRVDAQPDPADVTFLEDRVVGATVEATGHRDLRELAVFVRRDGEPVAGIYGWTWGGCCELQYLWVDPSLRGQGLATRLMTAAEDEARRRGCHQVVLFTHDTQAPGLYARRGYEAVGTVDGYPAGHAAHWFRLPLTAVDREAGAISR